MQTPLAVYIGRRFSSVRSKNMLIGVISLLSITGLSLGVAILITVLSVMNGFDRELQNKILALVPHITMSSSRNQALQDAATWAEVETALLEVEGITGSAPFLQLEGMLLANGKSKGILLNGVDPVAEKNISIIEEFLTSGNFDSLQDRSYQMLIGETLATTLGVSVGDSVTLVSTVVPITPLGEFTRQKRFTVGGIFRVGSQLDAGVGIIHIADAQRVYRLGNSIHGLRLQVDDLFNINAISRDIRTQVSDDFLVSDWTRDYGSIYENIRLSKTLVGFLLTLLVAVAAFNIVVSLVMVVREKQGDIAILRTMGASYANIRNIFLVQGFSVGLMGTFFGLLLGILFSLTVSNVIGWLERALNMEFLSADIYPVNYLPAQIQLGDIILVCGLTLFLTMLATLLPAYSAARVDPANALRFE